MKGAERMAFIKERTLCFNCLKYGHLFYKCQSRECYKSECKLKHHTLLHEYFATEKAERDSKDTTNIKVRSTSFKRKHVFCKVVNVKIKVPGCGYVETFAFLDDGSDGTFIQGEFAKSIGLSGTPETVTISTIMDRDECVTVENVSFDITGVNTEAETYHIENATTLPKDKFKLRSQHLPDKFNTGEYNHLVLKM